MACYINMLALVSHNSSLSFFLFPLYCVVYSPWLTVLRIVHHFHKESSKRREKRLSKLACLFLSSAGTISPHRLFKRNICNIKSCLITVMFPYTNHTRTTHFSLWWCLLNVLWWRHAYSVYRTLLCMTANNSLYTLLLHTGVIAHTVNTIITVWKQFHFCEAEEVKKKWMMQHSIIHNSFRHFGLSKVSTIKMAWCPREQIHWLRRFHYNKKWRDWDFSVFSFYLSK